MVDSHVHLLPDRLAHAIRGFFQQMGPLPFAYPLDPPTVLERHAADGFAGFGRAGDQAGGVAGGDGLGLAAQGGLAHSAAEPQRAIVERQTQQMRVDAIRIFRPRSSHRHQGRDVPGRLLQRNMFHAG